MKKIAAIVCCLGMCYGSFAQNGWFVRAQGGIGDTKMTDVSLNVLGPGPACDCGYQVGHQSPVLSAEGNVDIGYQYHRVRVITGLQLLTTGNMQNVSARYFPSGIMYISPVTDQYSGYSHLFIPLSVSLGFKLPAHLSLYPEIGTRLLFLPKKGQSSDDGGTALFFAAKLNVERALNKHLSVVLTPAYYTITAPVYVHSVLGSDQKLYATNRVFTLQAGILWHLPHAAKDNKATGKPE